MCESVSFAFEFRLISVLFFVFMERNSQRKVREIYPNTEAIIEIFKNKKRGNIENVDQYTTSESNISNILRLDEQLH